MSQNAHSLLLFFKGDLPYRKCVSILKKLDAGEFEKAEQRCSDFGVNFVEPWKSDWFNHSVIPESKFIHLYYETGTSYDQPLELLEELFDADLLMACLEVFYDQVGEYEQYFYLEGKSVSKTQICQRFGTMTKIIEEQFEADDDDLDQDECDDLENYESRSIHQLIKDKKNHEAESEELLESILAISKAVYETGKAPEEILEDAQSVLTLRALMKGVFQGVGFGVLTVLLFKGMWLWIALSVILTLILPIIYVNKVTEQFEEQDNEEESDEC